MTNFTTQSLTDTQNEHPVSVSGQVQALNLQALADAGIKTIINNRPDDEAPDQPRSADIAQAARQLGFAYFHIPFTAGTMAQSHVQEFADVYNAAEKPVHLFCRTGNRSTGLYQAAIEMDLLD